MPLLSRAGPWYRVPIVDTKWDHLSRSYLRSDKVIYQDQILIYLKKKIDNGK